MGALRSNYGDQFLTSALPVLEALIYDEYEKYPDMVPDMFRVMSSSKWGEQTSTMAGLKAVPAKNEGEATAEDEPLQGYDKTYTHTTYALFCSFSEELKEDDEFGMAGDTYRSLGLSAHQTRQIVATNVINNGFATDTGPDATYLFSTSHTMIGGHTYGNRPATDIGISVGGIRAGEIAMTKQVNHRNLNVRIMPATIMVPPDQMQTAEELVGSPERPDTANRAINTFYRRRYKLVVNPFLTSTTAWVMFAPIEQTQMRFYERVAPTIRTWEDESTGDVNTRIRFRFSCGYSDFIGTWGTTG